MEVYLYTYMSTLFAWVKFSSHDIVVILAPISPFLFKSIDYLFSSSNKNVFESFERKEVTFTLAHRHTHSHTTAHLTIIFVHKYFIYLLAKSVYIAYYN